MALLCAGGGAALCLAAVGIWHGWRVFLTAVPAVWRGLRGVPSAARERWLWWRCKRKMRGPVPRDGRPLQGWQASWEATVRMHGSKAAEARAAKAEREAERARREAAGAEGEL
jgi:hypothetical protein